MEILLWSALIQKQRVFHLFIIKCVSLALSFHSSSIFSFCSSSVLHLHIAAMFFNLNFAFQFSMHEDLICSPSSLETHIACICHTVALPGRPLFALQYGATGRWRGTACCSLCVLWLRPSLSVVSGPDLDIGYEPRWGPLAFCSSTTLFCRKS